MTDAISILYVKQSNVLEKPNLLQWNGIGDDIDLHICIVHYMQHFFTCEQLACDQGSASFIQINYLCDLYPRSVCNITLGQKEKKKDYSSFCL